MTYLLFLLLQGLSLSLSRAENGAKNELRISPCIFSFGKLEVARLEASSNPPFSKLEMASLKAATYPLESLKAATYTPFCDLVPYG